jgi:hypothetical protein
MIPKISLSRVALGFGMVVVAYVSGLANFSSSRGGVANAAPAFEDFSPVVGVWEVNVGGAPFGPHLFTFHSDHTFLSSNPDAGDPSTSDSDGEGIWQDLGRNKVKGKFKEYDADRTSHQFVGILTVTYTITVIGDTFTGNATATETAPDGTVLGSGPATFTATRMKLE